MLHQFIEAIFMGNRLSSSAAMVPVINMVNGVLQDDQMSLQDFINCQK